MELPGANFLEEMELVLLNYWASVGSSSLPLREATTSERRGKKKKKHVNDSSGKGVGLGGATRNSHFVLPLPCIQIHAPLGPATWH